MGSVSLVNADLPNRPNVFISTLDLRQANVRAVHGSLEVGQSSTLLAGSRAKGTAGQYSQCAAVLPLLAYVSGDVVFAHKFGTMPSSLTLPSLAYLGGQLAVTSDTPSGTVCAAGTDIDWERTQGRKRRGEQGRVCVQ